MFLDVEQFVDRANRIPQSRQHVDERRLLRLFGHDVVRTLESGEVTHQSNPMGLNTFSSRDEDQNV